MKNRYLFLSLIFLTSFYLHAQNSISQKTHNNLTTLKVNTDFGTVNVFLPELILNENASGSIQIIPKGKKEKQRLKNKAQLENYTISIQNSSVPLSNKNFTINSINSKQIPIALLDKKGSKITETTIQTKGLKGNTNLQIPEYIISGSPAKIQGSFDGNLENASVKIGNQSLKVLAESSSQIHFKSPKNLNGNQNLQLNENNKISETKVHVLHLDLSAGKLNLRKGEGTTIHIKVSGLQGVDKNVPLSITNLSAQNVTLNGGNQQLISINPSQSQGGVYNKSIAVRAISTGGFTVSVQIEPPTYQTQTIENSTTLCNCNLNNESHLIATDACQELGGNNAAENQENDVSSEDEEGLISENFSTLFTIDIPETITGNNEPIPLEINTETNNVVAAIIKHKNILDTEWTTIVQDNDASNGFSTNWYPPVGNDGMHEISTQIVNTNHVISESIQYSRIEMNAENMHADYLSTASLRAATEDLIYQQSQADIIGNQVRNLQKTVRELRKKYRQLIRERNKNITNARELIKIDKVLDKVPKTYKDSLQKLVDSLTKLSKIVPKKVDTAALKKAVDAAKARHEACKKRLAELKKKQKNLETERDNLKKEIDKNLKDLTDLHLDNGWIGKHGFYSDGSFWYGYLGDEFANTDIYDQANPIVKKLKQLKGPFNRAIKKLKKLPAKIVEAEAACDALSEAFQEALTAQKNAKHQIGAQQGIEDICRQIKSLLNTLKNWCTNNPKQCSFKAKLNKLLQKCPKTDDDIVVFWKDYDDLINTKQQKETALANEADSKQKEANAVRNQITAAEERRRMLEEKQRVENEKAEKMRQQLAKDIEEARKRKREQNKEKPKTPTVKRDAKPEPILDEPVNPTNKQLKFASKSMIRGLYIDSYIDNGPCHCTTKALAFSNNTNSAAANIIASFAITVAFAPLEAVSMPLIWRVGIGAAKSIANSVYGGEKITDELAKNLLDVIGGEIFPNLVGNTFVGNRVNDLAKGSLNEILEAEGVRVIKWEGETKTRNCGTIKGKSTMLVNPNTGWVVLVIKIENCPLVVVKYKVNKDGISVTKPTVQEVI
ncbi:MAG: hypothetical protein ACPG6B_07175 [Oceanihabitans sp.]